mmetsp:Transcript_35688/g.80471  ORF Transcript_35688/g.80471 Transcript_35688/m.80471 type:complete len:234 (-) Transcript_35688:1325-2026(-)
MAPPPKSPSCQAPTRRKQASQGAPLSSRSAEGPSEASPRSPPPFPCGPSPCKGTLCLAASLSWPASGATSFPPWMRPDQPDSRAVATRLRGAPREPLIREVEWAIRVDSIASGPPPWEPFSAAAAVGVSLGNVERALAALAASAAPFTPSQPVETKVGNVGGPDAWCNPLRPPGQPLRLPLALPRRSLPRRSLARRWGGGRGWKCGRSSSSLRRSERLPRMMLWRVIESIKRT